jgi:transcriptional regulator with XRE-family HTH domain
VLKEVKNMRIENLKKMREKMGMTQAQLALKLGVTVTTISRWEQGKNFPSFLYANKLNQIFKKEAAK